MTGGDGVVLLAQDPQPGRERNRQTVFASCRDVVDVDEPDYSMSVSRLDLLACLIPLTPSVFLNFVSSMACKKLTQLPGHIDVPALLLICQRQQIMANKYARNKPDMVYRANSIFV